MQFQHQLLCNWNNRIIYRGPITSKGPKTHILNHFVHQSSSTTVKRVYKTHKERERDRERVRASASAKGQLLSRLINLFKQLIANNSYASCQLTSFQLECRPNLMLLNAVARRNGYGSVNFRP